MFMLASQSLFRVIKNCHSVNFIVVTYICGGPLLLEVYNLLAIDIFFLGLESIWY